MWNWLKSRALETPLWFSAANAVLCFIALLLAGVCELQGSFREGAGFPWLLLGVPLLLLLLIANAAFHLQLHLYFSMARICDAYVLGRLQVADQIKQRLELQPLAKIELVWRRMLELACGATCVVTVSISFNVMGAALNNFSIWFMLTSFCFAVLHLLMLLVTRAQLREAKIEFRLA